MQNFELNPVSVAESKEVFAKTTTVGELPENAIQVAPKHRMTLTSIDHMGRPTELHFWLSRAFRTEPGASRYCVAGYVGKEVDETTMRMFYLSQSFGVWRVLPFSIGNEEDGYHYGKGYHHNSTVIVPELQKGMAQVVNNQSSVRSIPNGEQIFIASAPVYTDDDNVYDKLWDNEDKFPDEREPKEMDYVHMTYPRGEMLNGNFFDHGKTAPTNMSFFRPDSDFAPNFNELIDSWTQKSHLYKEVTSELFLSYNKRMDYLMCSDPEGRAWVGTVRFNDATLTTLGIMNYTIDGGDLTTAAFEHPTSRTDKDVLGGYGTRKTRRHGYSDMWPKYLSKVDPIIQYKTIRKK